VGAVIEEFSHMKKPGWGVKLEGDAFDVDDLKDRLGQPFTPWVEEYSDVGGTGMVLRSNDWASLSDARAVYMDADRILERLHGEALLYDPDAKRVQSGQVFRFWADGRRDTVIVLQGAQIKVTLGRVRVKVTSTTDDSSAPPIETETQRWFRDAETHELLAELFSQISKCIDWYDIYKIMEIAKGIGGSKENFMALLGSEASEWNRIWRTANCYRHAPNPIKYPLPNPPTELAEARLFVLKAVRKVI
jgi:hypothetical protein